MRDECITNEIRSNRTNEKTAARDIWILAVADRARRVSVFAGICRKFVVDIQAPSRQHLRAGDFEPGQLPNSGTLLLSALLIHRLELAMVAIDFC